MNSTEKAKSYMFYQAMSFCIKESGLSSGFSNKITESDAKSGNWFADTSKQADGTALTNNLYMAAFLNSNNVVTSDNSITASCGGEKSTWISSAISFWGYDPIKLLCSIGALRSDDKKQNCLYGNGNFTGYEKFGLPNNRLDLVKFQNIIKKDIYGNEEPKLDNSSKYVFYRDTFLRLCNDNKPAFSGDRNSIDMGDPLFYSPVKIVDPATGDIIDNSYYGTSINSDKNNVYNKANGSVVVKTCGEMVAILDDTASDFSKIIKLKIENKSDNPETEPTSTEPKTTCGDEVSGVGWIICPLISGLAELNDSMWKIASNLLKVNPLNQSDKIYEAWGAIRNIANVAFVIVFLIMIFSQISNFGISNYGIKKLLPRLIIGAILVNISFLIMQIVVDIANIVGSGLYDLIDGLVGSQQGGASWKSAINTLLLESSAAAATIVGATLAGGIGAVFWMLLPVLAMGALSLLAAVFTLIFRQAVIPILVILAPLAFVAYLLPNTESWYKKWQKLLMSTLLLYPLAAVIFGGSKFASNIMIGDGENFWKLLIGLIILVFPLFSLPFIASKGGAIVGAVGGFLTGLASKAKSPLTNVGKEYSNRAKLQADNKALNDKSKFNPRRWNLQRRARNEAISQNQKNELDHSRAEYIAKTIGADNGFVERMTKGGGASAVDRAKARAISSIGKIEDDQIKDAITLYNSEKGPEYGHKNIAIDYEDAVRKGDTTKTLALQDILRNSGAPGVASLHEKLEKLENDGVFNSNEKLRFSVKRDILKAGLKGKDAGLNAWSFASKDEKLYDLSRAKKTFESLTNEELAGQSKFVLDIATDSTKGGDFTIDPEVAKMILSNQNTSQKLGNNGTMGTFKDAAI